MGKQSRIPSHALPGKPSEQHEAGVCWQRRQAGRLGLFLQTFGFSSSGEAQSLPVHPQHPPLPGFIRRCYVKN